jgi:hypothetical protein
VIYMIRNGSYYLQGWIGWGQESCADTFDLRAANKQLKKLRAIGFERAEMVLRTTQAIPKGEK